MLPRYAFDGFRWGQNGFRLGSIMPLQFQTLLGQKHTSFLNAGSRFHRRILRCFKTVATTIPMRSNFYMHQFFLGRYLEHSTVADYLKAENYERLRSLLPRLQVQLEPIDEPVRNQPQGYFNKANLSDLFEYLSEEQTTDILGIMAEKFRTGGRIAYWNLLVPRHRHESLAPKLKRLQPLAESLHKEDRAFFYRAFHLEEVSST